MKIFDLFGKKKENSKALEQLQQAQELFEQGEFQQAFKTVLRGFEKDVNFKPLYELAIRCLDKLEAPEEKTLFLDALTSFKRPEPFSNLGNYFQQINMNDIALPFFKKVSKLDPSDTLVVQDIAISYARNFQIQQALDVLAKPKDLDFWGYWFYSKLKILANMPEDVDKALDDLSAILDQEPNQEELGFAREKVNEVKETLTRYKLVGQPEDDIQDWHFIQYGGVILDCSDDEDGPEGGRHVALWGSKEQVKELAQKLKFFLDKTNTNIQKVLYIDDRSSSILGLVIGKELGVIADVYEPNKPTENCLLVAANTTDYNEFYEDLKTIKEGQILFALNHCWLDSANVSPDIVGIMTQMYRFPWDDGHMRLTDDGNVEQLPADDRKPSEIANDIHNTEPEYVKENDFEFYLKRKEHLKGIGAKTADFRYNFTLESPVASPRFF